MKHESLKQQTLSNIEYLNYICITVNFELFVTFALDETLKHLCHCKP